MVRGRVDRGERRLEGEERAKKLVTRIKTASKYNAITSLTEGVKKNTIQ